MKTDRLSYAKQYNISVESTPNTVKKEILPVKAGKKITFQLKFRTAFGQELFISGSHALLGNNNIEQALPLEYVNGEHWQAVIEFDENECRDQQITYNYVLKNADGIVSFDWGNDKKFNPSKLQSQDTVFYDAWNYAGYFENAFYTEPFKNVLLKDNHTPVKTTVPPKITHVFMVKSPLLAAGQTLCLLGNIAELLSWNADSAILMNRVEGEDSFSVALDLSDASFPVAYKYGIYDTVKDSFIAYEGGDNRLLQDPAAKNRQVVVNDGFTVLPDNTWKGAGVAIPVFSLRSEQSLGVGEFTDLKLLVDWAHATGLKLIQLLPVNDTTATHSWTDSYPYAAISAFALHPIYLNVERLTGNKGKQIREKINKERARLNVLPAVDYEAVIKTKLSIIAELYKDAKDSFTKENDYRLYFEQNKHWLIPYAVFCYLRDLYGTVDFNQWPQYNTYDAAAVASLIRFKQDEIGLHYYIQYQLHLQLKEATAYAHAHGIIVKGDIPIGVYRHGADAWQAPELYHIDAQAGAPPDDFAVKGQNWGFPTYHWERMREDGFAWWKLRFEQMSYYFDAFRIDHILGFFRIFSIPMHAVEGIMGHFVPAIPVHINEFHSRHINLDIHRFTQPYITEQVLWEFFGYDNELVKKEFLQSSGDGLFNLKPAFATQRQVEAHFALLENDEHHQRIRAGLFDLISNVILFNAEQADGLHFHFRFDMESTSSFRHLDEATRKVLHELYVDYFFRRQDEFWKKEALLKLPALKRVTNMLVCGEDLGLVPACVPDVMHQLGLLSLEIQRMPKVSGKKFFHPNDAPYLSVVTPSTHDMSTIRGWWEEDKATTQQFYNEDLGQHGTAPYYCEPWINKAIVLQHLYSPAMWSIFQLQDLMGLHETLRRENPAEERINIPANPRHYWQYRMHLTLETLLASHTFNEELHGYIAASGR